ncbi:putative ATP-binding cassette transporter [Truncatella angustata]|uniref:ATP-binding cassette transporter n=1 Tax=Truncatella angustata TaxID=152316 RepID=A0A9P8UIM9_9PEZI|nr:putative ATP-binding cassette transporter [Truncatella angustata]KAH6652821.1 putative ATP-binding cassette transporter [Truncatella angustata]
MSLNIVTKDHNSAGMENILQSTIGELCRNGSDNQFGPRVDVSCRPFDFTLLFEDIFFAALPATIFLCVLPLRLRTLWKCPNEASSHKRATWKFVFYTVLLAFHVLQLAFRLQEPQLNTSMSTASECVMTVMVIAAGVLSYLENQRSIRPSDLLVLYFSASSLLSVPGLRSYWLAQSSTILRSLTTVTWLMTTLAVFLESAQKTDLVRPVEKGASKEQLVGLWSRVFFSWALPFLRHGYSSILTIAQVPRVDHELREDVTWNKLQSYWHSVKKGNYRLLRATFWSHLWLFVSAVPPRLALSAFVFCQPFLISSSVSYLATEAQNRADEYFAPSLIGAFVLVYLGIAVSRALYWRQTNRTIVSIRSCLIAMVYRHATGLRAASLKNTAIVTLMGTDVERIAQSLRLIHELWASFLELGIAFWLLERQMSWAFLVPLIITLASVLMTWGLSNRVGPAQAAWNECVQHRIAVTSSMLSNMKTVRMLGMTKTIKNSVTKLRELELQTSERFRVLLIWQILLGNAPVTIAPFITFVVYAIIAVATKSEALISAQAFASLSLISLATSPLIKFCQALPNLAQAAACFGRIQDFCLKEANLPVLNTSTPSTDSCNDTLVLREMSPIQYGDDGVLMRFERADIAWDSNSGSVLRNLTFRLCSGLTAITGPVASGKSTLLWTMLGETILKAGSMTSAVREAAFCAQVPWIMDDTIRHNITLGLEFDEEWYNFSIASSCLQKDLMELPRGDATSAGSDGASLSGGQRQRVALARAIYSRLPIVILDNISSGLDARTASALCNRLFRYDGHFRRAGISVVIATNDERFLRYMDTILILEGGNVLRSGSYQELFRAGLVEQDSSSETLMEVARTSSSDSSRFTQQETRHQAIHDQTEAPSDFDARPNGNWSVYAYYGRSAGARSILAWAISLFVGAACNGVITIWIEEWTEANQIQPNHRLGYYLGIYAVFVILTNISTAGELWFSFMRIISDTALKLHSDLLNTTLRAPISFFQQQDIGRILNRFSQDMDMIDMVLPMQAAQFTTGAAYGTVQLVILCVLGRYLTATVPACAGVLFFLQRYYLRTSRQLRLIDIEAKAPLYKHFIETLSGVTTIRMFGRGPAFHQQHQQMLDSAQAPYYMLLCIQQWLVLVLDLIVGALAVIIAAIALSPSRLSSDSSISAGDLGVALVTILQFNSLLSQTVQTWTKLETSIGAVSRVHNFLKDTPQEPVGHLAIQTEWPPLGSIRFENVVAGYVTQDLPVLTDLNLSIGPGEKIAICGPSGSGKSTILLALLRMIDIQGNIIIDNINISHLSGDDLRSRLNVLPQESFFLPGTIKSNLDVRGLSSMDAVQVAVERVGLWNRVRSLGGLEANLDPSQWSQGEKQLLCLARAILTPSKVLILDEATSSVDDKTESIMLDVIGSTFREQTIISVVHRYARIEQYDRVAVLKEGKIVEYDTPQTLLSHDSVFGELFRAYESKQFERN